MTINIEALINYLGRSYSEIVDATVIPYSSKPKGHSGSVNQHLVMAKEGINLSFLRETQALVEINLKIRKRENTKWNFPNVLPTPLRQYMPREWVHSTFGYPAGCVPPKTIMNRPFGWVEKYNLEGFRLPVSMQVDYGMDDVVEEVAFILTSDMKW
ncbi:MULTISPECIES: DUF6392 family protein [Enterobacter]|uniref:DUF6392 family protein n=1 Tax=Enterobacter TaxID=547 RepID=UPI0021CF213E|nr:MULTISPECIES: DUF6392 family protein [Enterobacter]MCU6282956.1 pyocin immunity protein [Enterobacter cloacae]MDO2440753.1 DUF6392 family protein [Enterobacter nematophilus]HEC5280742.1 pyocin immunity protein [Enterobacter cloacae]HEC5283201.1 pyocin immunity protein [Enterobacter cloacae]